MPSFEAIQEEISGMLAIPDEELTDEQRAAMDAYLNELGKQEASKVDSFGQFIRVQAATADACKKEAQRLAGKAKTAEGRIAWLKAKYLDIMQSNGLRKIQGNAYTLSVRESEAVAIPTDLAALPEIYLRRKESVEADKTVIKEALKAGQIIPGCELRKSYSLQIR